MRIAGPSSHAGCEELCGQLDGTLACMETEQDDVLAALVAPRSASDIVWVGEYQWPIEPAVRFQMLYYNQEYINYTNPRDAVMGGQPNWGRCTNGATSSTAVMGPRMMFTQPNNWNGGEDCLARTGAMGYLDNQCNEPYLCLCQWPGRTSDEFRLEHGPALTQRAEEAFSRQLESFILFFGLSLVLGSLPALVYVIGQEAYLRQRERTKAVTTAEVRLKSEVRRAVRRRTMQSGLSLWLGGLLILLSIFPDQLNSRTMWPHYGFIDIPFGVTEYWALLRVPGICLIGLSVLPADTGTIRAASLVWFIYQLVDALYLRWIFFGGLEAGLTLVWAGSVVGSGSLVTSEPNPFYVPYVILRCCSAVATLRSAIFCAFRVGRYSVNPLPGRLALRFLWYQIRFIFFLQGCDLLWVGANDHIGKVPYAQALGVARLVSGLISATMAVCLTAAVRRRIQGFFGGFGAAARDSSAASVITTMIGGDPVTSLRSANEQLRCIRISVLNFEDIEQNVAIGTDADRLYERTEKVREGGVDAFLSHSWRDDAQLKWEKLNQYKQDFMASSGGVEPNCWLDKVRPR